jgi:hypothetical protein
MAPPNPAPKHPHPKHFIPGLFHEGVHGAVGSLQHRLNEITDKARRRATTEITGSDKMFLKFLYGLFVIGGLTKGWPEASQLLRRYLANSPTPPLKIAEDIYQTSTVVKKEIHRQKQLISGALRGGKRNFKIEPQHIDRHNHMLLADNDRLKHANNRFWLHSTTDDVQGGFCNTKWSVPDRYEFEDFNGAQSKWTKLEVLGETLIVYDGMSKYLVNLGMASEFDYFSQWEEVWKWHQ